MLPLLLVALVVGYAPPLGNMTLQGYSPPKRLLQRSGKRVSTGIDIPLYRE
jgi:hypothetical protein